MQLIAFEKVKELIGHVHKTNDLYEIESYIKGLQHELKRDELFVSEIFNLLNEKSISYYREILDYLDGAIYIINSYRASTRKNPNGFVDLIKRGWTSIDYDDFIAFRSLEYRDPIKCETTDLFTELHNEAIDAGYKDLNNYINDTYAGIENYCVFTVQEYYCENLEASIKGLMSI
tara:strand:- start:212 stop:736 length:525 start_codon:yes stop_codon:yes gene_type:complete